VNERKRRIGENEAIFREINDQASAVITRLSVATDNLKIVCECGAPRCLDEILIPVAEYARVRDDATLFIIRPGHDLPETETVAAKAKDHWIVRKDPGVAERIARATDRRSMS
jgi:hypothetical protein